MVIDSSTLISLTRAGQLHLLGQLPFEPVILDVVWDEVVVAGRASQHADAVVIADALREVPRRPAGGAATVDDAVLAAAVADGAIACNDQTLGRRARNLGARWVRTADLVVLLERHGATSHQDAVGAIEALFAAGRISASLRDEYLAVLG